MTEYTFTISYYSEATLEISVHEYGDGFEAICRHPMTADNDRFADTDLALGESWFFFSGPDMRESIIRFYEDDMRSLLDTIADEMWEGCAFYFEKTKEDAEYWFRHHLYIAFRFGHFYSKHSYIRIPVAD